MARELSYARLCKQLAEFLVPVTRACSNAADFNMRWSPVGPWASGAQGQDAEREKNTNNPRAFWRISIFSVDMAGDVIMISFQY